MLRKLIAVLGIVAVLVAGCGKSDSGGSQPSAPSGSVRPSDFVSSVDNPFYPLKPGTTYTYTGKKDGKPIRDVLSVTHETKKIEGVPCVVLHDKLYSRGKLSESTIDWYTQDRKGNVWYFGENTKELDRSGKVTSTEGTWQAGVNGARPGIFMPADPRVGDSFEQEYYKGHAEDHFRVVGLSASTKVPYGSFRRALLTEEWTPLEPGVLDHKYYARGIGTVKEETVKGGKEVAKLVSFKR